MLTCSYSSLMNQLPIFMQIIVNVLRYLIKLKVTNVICIYFIKGPGRYAKNIPVIIKLNEHTASNETTLPEI